MKTAKKKTAWVVPKLLPPEELDRLILDFIDRGVDRVSTDAEFNQLALTLFRHQFARNLPYRRYCLALDCRSCNVEHWTQIPAVPTTAFKDAELTTLKPAERTAGFHSSGTTEHRPSRHFHSRETLALYEAALWPMFASRIGCPACPERQMAGQAGKPILLILTPTPAEAPHSSLVHMMETVRLRIGAPESAFVGATALQNGRALAKTVQSAIRNPQSTILLLGTAFAFVHLLDAVKSLPLPPGSRVMETGGYKGRSREVPREELHTQLSAKFAVPRSHIISEYGMCELSSQFYASADIGLRPSTFGLFLGPPWTRVQVIDPETGREVRDGERGLIRIYDLANRGSLIAIQTEDVGVRHGSGFELIGRAPQAEARGCSLMMAS